MNTADKLEQDAQTQRDNVESTLDALKDRMSLDQIIGEAGRFFGVNDAAATVRTMGQQVQTNPLAFGMIGLGVAWLAFGSDARNAGPSRSTQTTRPDASEPGVMSHAMSAASDGIERVKETVSHATERAADMTSSVEERFQTGMAQARDTAGQVQQSVATRLEDHPLLIGGLAVLMGAVVGAALPRTRTEDQWIGPQGDQLRDEAKAASLALRDRAVDAAQQTYDTAVDAARDEGLLPADGDTLASKLSNVAQAAVDEAKHQIDPVLQGEKAKDKPKV
ncbi:hypothetical protein [Pseudotabrizicola sp. 4114]|uniref:hypothetical protein n=1 Tax=Pseudotabrizicola sp. 4114 TaxID=2817731 RepID=UPI0028591FB0|nr:ElaB/YqjD/DUF883 family membrane-anchored ribosome-binding protein [Pseudorhodobacter sp. 4114]